MVIPQTATYELQDKVFVYKVVDGKPNQPKLRCLKSMMERSISWNQV